MEYILLDTNILIYREGEKILEPDVQLLSRLLMDSMDYKLCVHPMSIDELSKHKDERQRQVILSKVGIYKKLEDIPIVTQEFITKCEKNGNEHEYIDNNLLYTVYRNCVSYLITNDKGILKKSEKLGLSDKVLTISKALSLLSNKYDSILLKTPAIIKKEYLYNIDNEDSFFDSLRQDYKGFNDWLTKKKLKHEIARVTYKDNGKLGAFLMLKTEDEKEDYSSFDTPFQKGKRVKISTFKVEDNGKSIGEAFIKIAIDYAIRKNIYEVYVTIFDKQDRLINLFKEYGFDLYTYKETQKQDGTFEKEGVYLKRMYFDKTNYPIIKLDEQDIYILSIQEEFGQMLFPDLFNNHQLSFYDLDGTSTYSNVIKKVYISKSKIKPMKKNDILVFYTSQIKKSIACVCVVDDAFRANEIESFDAFEKIVRRRTVYPSSYLKEAYENGYLIILFKYYVNLPIHIHLKVAIAEDIVKAAPQSIQKLSKEKFEKIVKLSGSDKQIKI